MRPVVVGDVGEVDPVDGDVTAGRGPQAEEDFGDGGLAGSGGSDESDGIAGSDAQIDVVQRWSLVGVGEPHVVELDRADGVDVRGADRFGRCFGFGDVREEPGHRS